MITRRSPWRPCCATTPLAAVRVSLCRRLFGRSAVRLNPTGADGTTAESCSHICCDGGHLRGHQTPPAHNERVWNVMELTKRPGSGALRGLPGCLLPASTPLRRAQRTGVAGSCRSFFGPLSADAPVTCAIRDCGSRRRRLYDAIVDPDCAVGESMRLARQDMRKQVASSS